MNKKLFSALIIAFTLLSFSTTSYALFASGKITIKIVSEDGTPVDGARVGIGFDDVRSKSKENSVIGFTNSEGSFTGSETTTSGYLAFNVTKDGYYKTTGDYQFKGKNIFGWEPWNPELKVVLRKIENPAAMYARRVRKEIPFAKKEIGFDLIKADWVVPYGQGQTADFSVYLEADDTGINDFEFNININFNGNFNGYYSYNEDLRIGSVFKLPRYAQSNGYINNIKVLWRGLKRGSKTSWDSNRHYIFRIRAEEKNGKLTKAMYGKIFSDIELRSNRKTGGFPSIEFTYYLNPDYSRNLEFDPKRNLFGNLPDSERVTEP